MIFSNVDLTQKKQSLRNTYSDYESLLHHAAQLLNHSEELSSQLLDLMVVLTALNDGDDNLVLTKTVNGIKQRITFAEGVLQFYTDKHSDFAKEALETTYPSTQKGRKFKPKRVKGSKSHSTKYIEALVKSYPNSSAKELERLVEKKTIGDITSGTFANKVSAIKSKK